MNAGWSASGRTRLARCSSGASARRRVGREPPPELGDGRVTHIAERERREVARCEISVRGHMHLKVGRQAADEAREAASVSASRYATGTGASCGGPTDAARPRVYVAGRRRVCVCRHAALHCLDKERLGWADGSPAGVDGTAHVAPAGQARRRGRPRPEPPPSALAALAALDQSLICVEAQAAPRLGVLGTLAVMV